MPAISGASNVCLDFEATTAIISVDLSITQGESKSGKTTVVATTSGNKPMGGTGALMGLNVYLKEGKSADLSGDVPCPDGLKNCIFKVEGSMLKISVDLTKDCGASSTGKTTVIASTSGSKALGKTNVSVGLNIFAKEKLKLKADNLAVSAAKAAVERENQGATVKCDGDQCSFTIDTSKSLGVSSTGKSNLLATSGKAATVPGTEASYSLMVCKGLKSEGPAADTEEAEVSGAKNIRASVSGGLLVLTCDLSKNFGPSSSGKTTILASTAGIKRIGDTDTSVNLSVWRKRSAGDQGAPPAKKSKPNPEHDEDDDED